ncbi:translation initiation factor IF-2 [Sphingobacterium sp. Mn56C]|uniref:translation initiation factor IF-2 n=1 Tax=Sphingobacterium sp. Mn56C TaxID=3395261 RepID=UPI003BDE09EC
MTEGKSINLLKAAKELNIGIGTAVDFLSKKGFDVDAKPTTKLTADMFNVLLREFQGDKIAKDEAKQIVIGKIRRDESPVTSNATAPQDSAPSKNDDSKESEEVLVKNVSATTPAKEEQTEENTGSSGHLKVVGKINLDNLGKGKFKKDTAPKATEPTKVEEKVEAPIVPTAVQEVVKTPEAPKAEVKVENEAKPVVKEEPKVEVKPEPQIQEKITPAPAPAPAPQPQPQPEVKAEKPAQPELKEATAVAPKEGEKTNSQDNKQITKEQPSVVKTEIKQEVNKSDNNSSNKGEAVRTDAPKNDGVIRARSEKLEGPKVVGKIELPTFKPKEKPVASSSNANQDNKRKRKRTHKPGGPVSPNDQNNQNNSNNPQNNNNTSAGQNRTPGQGRLGDNRNTNNNNRPGGNNQYGGGRGRPNDNRGRGNNHNNNRQDAPKEELSEKEIQDQIKATLARLSGAGKSGKFAQRAKLRRQKRDDVALSAEEAAMEQELMSKVLRVTEFVTANELANLMDAPVTKVIGTCMNLGMFVSINQRLDAETLTIVADEFGYQIEFIKPEDEETAELEEADNVDRLVDRAPIVTVMGHVDHGKTSLLDYIRKANVTKGEAGGITQHIGAYAVNLDDNRKITFLDTPGHEAFTAMRARGAKVTDIVIIVIAADDAVMPQTKEAINHAQAAGVPIVFAFTKVDKPGANADKIREQLSTMNILVEDWGGKYQAQEISAKTGENVELLLEKVLLEAELLELKADPKKRAVGSVIEAALDKGRGIVTTVLVQGGTLRVGDAILAGSHSGKVKALTNERGERVKEAGPSVPVQILGMSGAPTAGDKLYVMESESEARQVANKRLQLQREQGMRATKHITLDEIGRRLAIGNFKELNIIVKGDVDGSIEALSDSLLKLSTDEIQVNIIHKSVGAISESDVLLASASDAIIVGFQVRPTQGARKLAENEQIDIRLYSIIYDAIEEIKSAMEGMLEPKFEEKIVAEVEIRETFKISKVGTIAGCMVREGKINRNNDIRIIRDGVVIHTGRLASLKRFKDDVKEVSQGYECGLNIDRFNDIQVGDIVEAYEQVEVKRKL